MEKVAAYVYSFAEMRREDSALITAVTTPMEEKNLP